MRNALLSQTSFNWENRKNQSSHPIFSFSRFSFASLPLKIIITAHTKIKATNNQIENPIMRNCDVIMPATMQQATTKTIPFLSCLLSSLTSLRGQYTHFSFFP